LKWRENCFSEERKIENFLIQLFLLQCIWCADNNYSWVLLISELAGAKADELGIVSHVCGFADVTGGILL